jgi:hypothetical protein
MSTRKLSETMIAMSFVERWMKISDAGLDNKFAEPNYANVFLLFLPGITDCRQFIGHHD